MATKRMSLSNWTMYGGGTATAPGKHSYDIETSGRKYSIDPYSTDRGRHAGYYLRVYPSDGAPLYAGIGRTGDEVRVNSSGSSFRTPQAAAKAAGLHRARRS